MPEPVVLGSKLFNSHWKAVWHTTTSKWDSFHLPWNIIAQFLSL